MEKLKDFIFQIDSDLVKKQYIASENIKVIDTVGVGVSKLCVIYFSSNELYYPNTEVAFRNSIISKDKYEWVNNKFPNASRHIFVRDIQKQWYIEGTCVQYNTPILVAEYLSELSKGYTIFTLGSSAGGFAAILFGSMLQAKRVYAFNAQLNLNLTLKDSNKEVNPILFKYADNRERSQYYEVSNFLDTTCHYFYFQSANSHMDTEQYNACAKKEWLHKIEFSTSNHGFPFLRHNLLYVLNLSTTELLKMGRFKKHPLVFSIQIDGLYNALVLTGGAVLKRLKKKLIDEKKLS